MIEADPMISQDQLARRLGISRSSVAVHISNLMKKGYIAGKGYVLRRGNYAAIVGGVNVDIGGRPFSVPIPGDSNPGKVITSLGGVGRNIAHNASLLGVEVRFLTALGDDFYAERIAASCAELNIDIRSALRIPGGCTPTYLFLNDNHGEMLMAVSDMRICDEISPSYLSANASVLDNAQLVVADANIPAEAIAWLAGHCSVPLFADPVSRKKAEKLKPFLGRFHTLKPNRLEAEYLSGIRISNEQSLRAAAQILLATGLQRVFLSLGADGILAADDKEMLLFSSCPADVRNTTGAGDAFMAALMWAYLENLGLEDTARFAAAAASLTVESPETVHPGMSVEVVLARREEFPLSVRKI